LPRPTWTANSHCGRIAQWRSTFAQPVGEAVKRFGFHTFRHSLATCLMDEQENPAVVQAIMRHSKMYMTLYYSHSRALGEAVRARESARTPRRSRRSQGNAGAGNNSVTKPWSGTCVLSWLYREIVGLNSAVECHLHTSSLFNTFNDLNRLPGTAKYCEIRGNHTTERVL